MGGTTQGGTGGGGRGGSAGSSQAGHGGAGANSGGNAGAAGAGAGAAGDSGSGGAGGGEMTCAELSAAYDAELAPAKVCSPSAVTAQCQTKVKSVLGCDSSCDTVVNNATTLNALAAAFSSQSCPPPVCPAVSCTATQLGVCTAGGGSGATCKDHT
jgi:hypothetical protein